MAGLAVSVQCPLSPSRMSQMESECINGVESPSLPPRGIHCKSERGNEGGRIIGVVVVGGATVRPSLRHCHHPIKALLSQLCKDTVHSLLRSFAPSFFGPRKWP